MRVQELQSVLQIGRWRPRRDFSQALGDVNSEVDQDTVSVSFDLKVPEETVGTEQVQGLVNRIVGSRVG